MKTLAVSRWTRVAWQGAVLAALLLSLAFIPVAQADFDHATITVYAPGAPTGAWVSVQWQDRSGAWRDVTGWQSGIEVGEDSDLAFKQWAVYPEDYGRGPFRWVILTELDGTAWATSPKFFLPNGDGASLSMTLTPRTTTLGASTITVIAHGAPANAWVSVQWQDGLGQWHAVDGWQGELDRSDDSQVAFKQWGVRSTEFGQGPFRWVIYTEQGGSVWAISPKFDLPDTANANLTLHLTSKVALLSAETIAAEGQAEALTLGAQTVVSGLSCGGGACDFSAITVYVPDAPALSKVAVQWQDGLGQWHDVQSWQGDLDRSSVNDTPFKRWTVSANYGNGPFRWVIYNELGDEVWGISPSFNLPERAGLEISLFLSAPSASAEMSQ